MSPPQSDQNASRSVLSWESVVESDESDKPGQGAAPQVSSPSAVRTDSPDPTPTAVPAPAPESASVLPSVVPVPSAPPAPETTVPEKLAPAVVAPDPDPLGPISLSMVPLARDPQPSVSGVSPAPVSAPTTPAAPVSPPPSVLGEMHIDLAPISGSVDVVNGGLAPDADEDTLGPIDLKIAPLDVPHMTPSGGTPVVDEEPAAAQSVANAVEAAQAAAAAPSTTVVPPAPVGLPTDPVSADPTPTTVIPGVVAGQIAPPAIPGSDPGSDVVAQVEVATPAPASLPQHQPNQTSGRRPPTVSPLAVQVPDQSSRKQRKQRKKQKSGGAGGVALFFTLLVLVGLIVGAIIYGRPYLFPDDWDSASKPYGDAVGTARGTPIAEPVLVSPQSTATYNVGMTNALVGEWENDLAMWRSYGLANGAIDAPLLRDLVEGWTAAYYSAADREVFVDESLTASASDGAIAEAMAAAALDEETNWSVSLDPIELDGSAMSTAQVISSSRATGAATSFGEAVSERRIDVAAFLPTVLAYRVNAPLAYAELVPESAVRLDAITSTDVLGLASGPELVEGDAISLEPHAVDRSFWYLVFASYTDAATAYTASNDLVESALTVADRAGVSCSYATFSGTDIGGTERVANTLQQWTANVPAEMLASFSVLDDGTMQLTSCDPGIGFESLARFGVASELIRWRLVELAALSIVDPQVGTPAQRLAEVARVQQSQAGITMMTLPFDTTAAESARLATIAAQPPVVVADDAAATEGG